MKYAWWVRHNGVDYAPGEEVPSDGIAEKPVAVVVEKVEVVESESKGYTKTEINRMPTDELKKLAKSEKLNFKLSGAELKKLLIEHFGL